MARPPTYLHDPTINQLMQATANNHTCWMTDTATSTGGRVHEDDGVTWIHTTYKDQVEIAFPHLTAKNASAAIDHVVRRVRRLPVKRFACWSLSPSQPRELGAILVARGFGWSWRPRWMWLDMRRLNTDHPKPDGVRVELVGDGDVWDIGDLPYYNRAEAEGWRVLNNAAPRRNWQVVARLDGEVVGHTKVLTTAGKLGIAGIYNVGVRSAYRGRGIGKAVIGAALQHAKDMGCGHATLNGTGGTVYRQLGFELIGYGQTWVCRDALSKRYPSKQQVEYVEAIGRQDTATLERLAKRMSRASLNRPLASGMTPMQLAAEMGAKRAQQWLVDRLNT
jgi:GNAT superfamily N-acetyltransferase